MGLCRLWRKGLLLRFGRVWIGLCWVCLGVAGFGRTGSLINRWRLCSCACLVYVGIL